MEKKVVIVWNIFAWSSKVGRFFKPIYFVLFPNKYFFSPIYYCFLLSDQLGDTKTIIIRPFALKCHGSIAHSGYWPVARMGYGSNYNLLISNQTNCSCGRSSPGRVIAALFAILVTRIKILFLYFYFQISNVNLN